MKEKLSKLIEKDGFYLVLFICVSIVAIGAVITSKRNLDEIDRLSKAEEEEMIIYEDESEDSIEISTIEDHEYKDEEVEEVAKEHPEIEKEKEIEEEIEELLQEDIGQVETEIQETVDIKESLSQTAEFLYPVTGEISRDYTENNLIYSKTLDKWTSHKGIDILGEEGSQVLASLSGEVEEVYDDPLWGRVIIIDHGNNLQTKYANLSEDIEVKEGDLVNKGDSIAKIGNTAAIEMMEEGHVHFEVIKDGVEVNPNDYLPSFSDSN